MDRPAVFRVRSTVETTDFNQDLAFPFPFPPHQIDFQSVCLRWVRVHSFDGSQNRASQLAPDICTRPSINQANCNEFWSISA